MTTTTTRTGSRIRLPENPLKVCASCLIERGNKTRDWDRISDADGVTLGWTCPTCPRHGEPIRLEPSGRFVAVVGVRGEDGKRKQLKRRFDRLDDARAWVEEVRTGAARAASDSKTFKDPSRFTVAEVCKRWLDHRASEVGTPGGLRPSSLQGYRLTLKSILGLIGSKRARDLTPSQIERALRTLATDGGVKGKPLSHRSRTYALGALRQAFKFAQREGWVTENPAALAKVQGKPQRTRKATRWTVAELRQFRAYVDEAYSDAERLAAEPWVPAAMRLALCGLRRSEVLGLDWTYVGLDAGTATVAASRTATGSGRKTDLGGPKTENSARTVAVEQLHPGTAKALRKLWMKQGRPESGLVICDAAGEPVHPDTFSWRFKTLCQEAGVRYPGSLHNTRHTLATALEEAGVPANQGAALLGHDVATYTRFYLVADHDAGATAAAVAGRIFAEDFRAL